MSEVITVEVEDQNETQKTLKVSVASSEVEDALQQAMEAVRKKAKIKGFRKGKAPGKMVMQMYEQEIQTEAVYGLLDSTYPQALDKVSFRVVGNPSITDINFQEGEPFHYTATVEFLPDVQVKKYKGLKIKKLEEKITQDKIDEQIQQIREGQGRLVPVDPPRPLSSGDFVIIDIGSTIDGEPFKEGSGEGVTLEMGKSEWIPGFEEKLLGAGVEEERQFELTLPEDDEELGGKAVNCSVKVREIKSRVLPELNDDLARDVGDFKTLQDLRERIEKNLKEAADERAKNFSRDQIIDALIEANPIQVPKSVVDSEIERMVEDAKHNLKSRGQEFPDDEGLLERVREDFRPQADKRVRAGLLIEAVSTAEKVEIGDEEVERYLQNFAERVQKPLEEIKHFYQNEKALDSLRLSLMEEKTLEFIAEQAKIIKKIRDFAEIAGAQEGVK